MLGVYELKKNNLKMMRATMEALFLLTNMCKGEITDVVYLHFPHYILMRKHYRSGFFVLMDHL